jgi:hypothetical protein
LDEIDDIEWAIADSGCSDNYFTPKAKTKNQKTSHTPVNVTLPDGTTLRSSHSCEMDVPLPKSATTGYIIPGMKNHSLISVTKLCHTGCKVLFSTDECVVIHKGIEVLRGRLHPKNGLWYLPINQKQTDTTFLIHNDSNVEQTTHQANNIHQSSTLAETIQFIHQCLFSPTVDTLCKAIDNNQLIGFPPITSSQVRKYLPESTATAKGHMNRLHKGTRSTTKQHSNDKIATEQDFRPLIDEDAEVELFIGATIVEQNEGTIYTDNTGRFPIQSFHEKRCNLLPTSTGAMQF